MTFSPQYLQSIIHLIEERLGLSATTLARVGLADLLLPLAEDAPHQLQRTLRDSNEQHPVWQRLIHALTIGETYFLRDKVHFKILREHILPRLILERRQARDLRLTVWCVGCSTGEEAYSIATVLHDMLPDMDQWQIKIYATDINQRAIDVAIKAQYREWSFRQTPAYFRQRYFTPIDDRWQLNDSIRQMVTFSRMNALRGFPANGVDIVFARHMLMYLAPEHARAIETHIYHALANRGWLVLGQAEALHSVQDRWLLHLFPGTPIYQKVDLTQTIPEPMSYPTQPIHTQPMMQDTIDDDTGHYAKAVAAIHADHPDEAEQHLGEVLSRHPQHAKTHIALASILANRKRYPEALTHIEAALSISGMYADAHYIKALIQIEQNEADNAIQSLSAAIYCNRNHALAGLMLGNIYHERRDSIRAARNWRNALRAIQGQPAQDYVSDVSDMTVTRLRGMIQRQQRLLNSTSD